MRYESFTQRVVAFPTCCNRDMRRVSQSVAQTMGAFNQAMAEMFLFSNIDRLKLTPATCAVLGTASLGAASGAGVAVLRLLPLPPHQAHNH